MQYEKWLELVGTEGFWGGVFASILAAAIVGVALFIFKNSLKILIDRREKGRREEEIFQTALEISSPYAPFAFGIVQGRALRYFLIAVFIAYVGDIMGLFWPLNIGFYALALIYIGFGIRWFFKIEKRGMEILSKIGNRR